MKPLIRAAINKAITIECDGDSFKVCFPKGLTCEDDENIREFLKMGKKLNKLVSVALLNDYFTSKIMVTDYYELTEHLQKLKDDIDARMLEAVKSNDYELVLFYISKGADRWFRGMCQAALNGYITLAELFAKKGKFRRPWDDCIEKAAEGNQLTALLYFANKCEKIPWNDALLGAARGGHTILVENCINMGAGKYNGQFYTENWNPALCAAAENGHTQLVDKFIKLTNYNPNAKPIDFNAAMISASKGGHRHLVDYFISLGAWEWHDGLNIAERNKDTILIDSLKARLDTCNYLVDPARNVYEYLQ